jgi:hypothetical protein
MKSRNIPKLDKNKLIRLNIMNYQVNNADGHYYLQDGINGLIEFAAKHSISSFALVTELMNEGQWTGKDEQGEAISVTMI